VAVPDAATLIGCADSAEESVLFLLLRGVPFTDLHGDLYRFDPEHATTTKLGTLDCPAAEGAFPYSMAVDREGIVWVYYWYDSIYRVDPADMSCTATSYTTKKGDDCGLPFVFSMAFGGAPGKEQVIHAALTNPQFTEAPCLFGHIDPLAPAATELGVLGATKTEYLALATRDDGTLFALGEQSIWEIDASTGARFYERALPQKRQSWPSAWTFWGSSAYLFSHFGLTSHPVEVVRHDPGSEAMELVTSLRAEDGELLLAVGAGVGKCRDSLSAR
jgi:hypothetical protein